MPPLIHTHSLEKGLVVREMIPAMMPHPAQRNYIYLNYEYYFCCYCYCCFSFAFCCEKHHNLSRVIDEESLNSYLERLLVTIVTWYGRGRIRFMNLCYNIVYV